MKRRTFIRISSLSSLGLLLNYPLMSSSFPTENTARMPALFLGHGSPMNAVEDNVYTRGWTEMAKGIPTPKAILIVSAHWETRGGTKVFSGQKPKMIYDMYGFPKNLYEVDYPVDGQPELAQEIVDSVSYTEVAPTHDWGLDHGAWSVLVKMFPEANIPCFQISLNQTRDLQWHYDFAKELRFLRNKGVLILSSGNIVHNLRYMRYFNSPAPDWALTFDELTTKWMEDGDHQSLINYQKTGQAGLISVNSAEHYIPLLYTLALQEKNEPISFTNQQVDETLLGIGMRCVRIG